MQNQYIIKIGSKGEIFPPKEVRDYLNLNKDQTLLLKVYPKRMIIQKIDSLEEILNQPSVAKISYHVLKNMGSEFD
jgi:bifunctional DNA-binding transcriptional regulator/antitoxin component of YhaV-PrlF toxin-antitoxin module